MSRTLDGQILMEPDGSVNAVQHAIASSRPEVSAKCPFTLNPCPVEFNQMPAKRLVKTSELDSRAVSADQVPVPDVESPRAFDEWRRAMSKIGHDRNTLSTVLAILGTPLSRVRAAQLVISQVDRAQMLCSGGLVSNDPGVYQLAKVVLAAIDITAAYSDSDDPLFIAEGVVLRLKNIISEIKTTGGHSEIHQEALARAHVLLFDALLLFRNYDAARFHAAEAESLGEALGIRTIVVSAKFQRASLAFYNGNVADAHQLFKQVMIDPCATDVLVERASNAIGNVLLYQGDEDGLLDYLSHQSVSDELFFRILTLREHVKVMPDQADAGGLQAYANAWHAVGMAFEAVPWKAKVHFQSALKLLHSGLGKIPGFMQTAHDCLASFVHLKLGDYNSARHLVPSLEQLTTCPPFVRLFGNFLRVEIAAKNLPDLSYELYSALECSIDALLDSPLHVIPQLSAKMQLLAPRGVALVSQHPKAPYALRAIGRESILNLNEKTIKVFGVSGLRPTQAAAIIMNSFGIDEPIPQDGDGQRASLQATLNRQYFDRKFWYTPVSALHLAWLLLCCANVAQASDSRQWIGRSVAELESEFAFIPRLQRQTLDPFLDNADRVVKQLAQGAFDPITAEKLLFGRRGFL